MTKVVGETKATQSGGGKRKPSQPTRSASKPQTLTTFVSEELDFLKDKFNLNQIADSLGGANNDAEGHSDKFLGNDQGNGKQSQMLQNGFD